MPSFLAILGHLLALVLLAAAQSPSPTTSVTRVIQVFFVAERSYEGLPYTLLHRVSGSIVHIDANLTTIVITSTRADQRTLSTTTSIPATTTLASTTTTTTVVTTVPAGGDTTDPTRPPASRVSTSVGRPSTITQGPATFLFTHTHPDTPEQTLINRCSLNGTVAARCAMTHVGAGWYARNTAWNGTFSTYRYNWTSGDRFGFAPVTVTAGAEGLGEVVVPSASGSTSGAAGRGHTSPGEGGLLMWAWVVGMVGVGAGVGWGL